MIFWVTLTIFCKTNLLYKLKTIYLLLSTDILLHFIRDKTHPRQDLFMKCLKLNKNMQVILIMFNDIWTLISFYDKWVKSPYECIHPYELSIYYVLLRINELELQTLCRTPSLPILHYVSWDLAAGYDWQTIPTARCT